MKSYKNSQYFIFLLLMILNFGGKIKAQNLLSESFNYAGGTLLTSTGTGTTGITASWLALSGTGINNITASTGNLTYPGSIGNGIGNKISLLNNGQDIYRSFTSTTISATSPVLYVSMIVNVSSAQETGDYFFSLNNSNNAPVYIRSNGNGFNFGVLRTAGSGTVEYESTIRPFNTHIYIVVKYEFVSGTLNDLVKLYVNPSLSSEPSNHDVAYTATGTGTGTDPAYHTRINLYQGTVANAPTLEIDGINVGTSWESVTSAIYDYGDAPVSYDYSKDGVYVPAGHTYLSGVSLGNMAPTQELTPYSVSEGTDNNGTNGDGTEEDAIDISISQIRKNVPYSLNVPVINTTGTKYLYGWIDFNNDGKFQATEAANVVSFNTTGNSTQTLNWTAAQTATIVDGSTKLYMRLRLSDRLLSDFTTIISGGTDRDERSIGNGSTSTTNSADYPIAANGEVEDYQIEVVNTFDFGDLPLSFENDKDGNYLPAVHAPLPGFTLGNLIDVETSPASVTNPEENNAAGDNSTGTADEDALPSLTSISRGIANSFSIPVNIPGNLTGTKYLYGWMDLNGDGQFQAGEAAVVTTTATTATNLTLTWTASQTATIPQGVSKIYLRLRWTNTVLADFTTVASGGATIDERSIGNGATGTTISANNLTIAYGEVEDYQLPVDWYDFGDAPITYDQAGEAFVPARQKINSILYIGGIPDEEPNAQNVESEADNNGNNGDGPDEDGIDPSLYTITQASAFSLPVKVSNNTGATKILYGWIDFNNNGIFEASEVASVSIISNSINNTVNLNWAATATTTITTPFVYLRLRLSSGTLTDNTSTLYDERAIADGLNTGKYSLPNLGEIEDYQLSVNPVFNYGITPDSYEINNSGISVPARHKPDASLYLGNTFTTSYTKKPSTAGDGITSSLPELNAETNSYSVDVKVYKTVTGTATLHGWIDMDGDGLFSAYEYTSTTVTGTTGEQIVTLTWPQPFYFSNSTNKTHMRLRLTTATFTDNVSTLNIDERSIGDGLNTGIYGNTYANGEIEDYIVPLAEKTAIVYPDSDGDGIPDNLDWDSDNDGIPDSEESLSLTGTSFKLYNTRAYGTPEKWVLSITGKEGTQVTYTPIGQKAITATIPGSQFLNITILSANLPLVTVNNVTSNRFIPISSTAPISIIQEILGSVSSSQDAAVVYPETLWGTEYRINSYYYISNSQNNSGMNIFSNSDNNIVVIKNKSGAQVASFTLNEGQNYMYHTTGIDISGYTVSASEKVGIMVFVECANSIGGACDNTLEFVLPNNFLGTKFLTTTSGTTSRMIITATQDATAIRVDGITQVLLSAGDTYLYTQNDGQSQIIETNKPVQFMKVTPYNYDPSIATVQDITKASVGPVIFTIPNLMTDKNYLSIFVQTKDTDKILYNGSTISGWAVFQNDPTYSYVTLSNIIAGSFITISSTTGNIPFLTDWWGQGFSVSDATSLIIGGYDLSSGILSPSNYIDTDEDGIPNHLDLDSDNDGCVDAMEGGASLSSSHLVNAGGNLSIGNGSKARNRNFCASSNCIDTNGIPLIVGSNGQSVGSSNDPFIHPEACLICYKPAAIQGLTLDGNIGISALNRTGTETDYWPMVRKGAWMVLESKTKGFVMNRLTTEEITAIPNPNLIEGMMVYDTTEDCMKVYTTVDNGQTYSWKCMGTQTCPD